MYLKKKDFYDPWFYKMCVQEFDTARHYLKNCGKPETDIDRWFIEFNKDTVKIFGNFLKDCT
jgi:hypothetical protein